MSYISSQSYPNESLLSILLISCGILGSIMSCLRNVTVNAAKRIVFGASVGFVALLSVKSGSTLFIMQQEEVDVPFNAYSMALAGVIAGMFSEKLYLSLALVTDEMHKKAKDSIIK